MALAELPTTIIHLILSFLQPREAFLCSATCKNFHTAASYFFYEEYVKEHWSLPTTPSAVIDFFMQKSRHLWSIPLSALSSHEPHFHLIQNVKSIAQGFQFQAFLLHTHDLLLVRNGEIFWSTHFDKPVEEICAAVGTVGVLLRGGTVEMVRVSDGTAGRESVPSEEIATHVCLLVDRLVISTESHQVVIWDGSEIRSVTFEPPVAGSVLSMDCHGKLALILFEGGHLYRLETNSLTSTQDPFFKKKPIGLLSAGLLHSLALQREELPPLSSWNTQVLIDWLDSNGFADCRGVVLHSKITGKALEDADDDFFLDVLGIREAERVSRLKYLRSQYHSRTFSAKCALFGWGKNIDGQLGRVESVYSHPIAIELPEMKKNEIVKAIYCSKTYSFLLTSQSRVYSLGGTKAKNRPPGVDTLPWTDITAVLTAGQATRSIEALIPGNEELFFLTIRKDQRNLPQKRLKGANLIMNQIMWDPKLNLVDFKVGYEDRFVGIVEVTAAEFSRSEIPSHRIRYFTRGGEVVWDRRTRVNRL